MGRWKKSRVIHILLSLILIVAVGCATVAGMMMEGTKEYKEYAGQDVRSPQSTFYVSQSKVEALLDGYLRLYEQYMQIGSIIASDGMIDYDTVLLTSVTDKDRQYTLKELVRDAASTGVYSSRFRTFMEDFAGHCDKGISYSLETQFQMEAKDKVIIDGGNVYQFNNHTGTGVRDSQLENVRKYLSNMELVSSLTKDYGKHYQKKLEITIGHLEDMPAEYTAASSFEKYIITFYEKYAKWYFLDKICDGAKNDQGTWTEEFKSFYNQYENYADKPLNMQDCFEELQQEAEDTYSHIPENKMPWSMHRIPRTMETATDYAVFLVETYQELKYLFSETNFAYAYLDSSGMLLTNNEKWWEQVQRMVGAGKVEQGSDAANVLFCYYDNKDYNGQSNLQRNTFKMSGNVQEKLIQIGEEYQSRSYHIAVGIDLQAVRQGLPNDAFVRQFRLSRQQVDLAWLGQKFFLPSLAVALAVLLLLFVRCGHSREGDGIVLSGFDQLWLEPIALCVLFFGQIYYWVLQMWNGSMVRLEFLLSALALLLLSCFGIVVFISIVKRIKAHRLCEQSILFRFVRDVLFGRLRLGEVVPFFRKLFWEIPLTQRYVTLFLVEGLLQLYFVVFLCWLNRESHGGVLHYAVTGFGVASFCLYGVGLVFLILWQFRCLHNEKIERSIIRDVERIASGDFSAHIGKPAGASYEKTYLIYLLNRIGARVDEAVEQSIRSERMKTELIANVSHDIKTPLTSVINYVDLMKRQPVENEQVREYMEILERKSQRLKVLIEDLIEASKASSGAMELDMGRLDFGELVSQTNGEFEDYFAESDLDLVSEVPDAPLYFLGDGRRVYRVLENLYMNTKKYALTGTRVYVKLEERQEGIAFSMRNISKEKLNITPEELTERFVRGDSSRSTEGSGLGLSIAKSLTELMDGQFQIFLDGDLFHVEVVFPPYTEQE